MRMLPSLIIAIVASLLFPKFATAQALFTPDPTPLERPAPLKTLRTADTAKVCEAITKTLADNGFKTTRDDCDLGEFEATKKTNAAGEFDKVVIWLERDFGKPREALRLYFLYGRFETLAGHQEPVRIKTTSADEERNAGALKEALVSLKI